MHKLLIIVASLVLSLFFININGQTFTGGGGIIPKNDYEVYDIQVSGVGELNAQYGLERVCINLTFPTDENLRIALRSPFGSIIFLSQNIGGLEPDYIGTCFDNNANEYIFQANPPYSGTFMPETPLGTLNNNRSGDGTWSLIIFNNSKSNEGELINWSLKFSNTPAPPPEIPSIPTCNTELSENCATRSHACNLNEAFCGSYNRSNGPPFDSPGITYFTYRTSEINTKFRIWLKNGIPDRSPNGPIPMFLKLNIYKDNGTNSCTFNNADLVSSLTLPYNLEKDFTYYQITIPSDRCGRYVATVSGTGGNCYFEYIIMPVAGLDTKEIVVTPDKPIICKGESVELKVTQGCGPFIWSPATGLNTTEGDVVIASPEQTTTYTVTSVDPCPKTQTVTVEVFPQPVANAGPDQTKCSNAFEMNANMPQANENSYWEVIDGDVTPTPSTDPKQIFILHSKTATLRWHVKNEYCSSFDDVKIENASPDNFNISFEYPTPVCIIQSTTLAPTLGTQFVTGGVFSSQSGLSINPNTGVINLNNSTPGDYIVYYNININNVCGNATFAANIKILPYEEPIVNFAYPSAICNDISSITPTLPNNFTPGGTFSANNGLIINPNTGEIDIINSNTGNYTITYTYNQSMETCLSSKSYSQNIRISARPNYQPSFQETSCDYTGTGIGRFDLIALRTKIVSDPNPTVKYYKTLSDAENSINEITSNLTSYQNTMPFLDKIFARIEVANRCTVYSEITLKVFGNPYSDTLGAGPYYLCLGSSLTLNAGTGFKYYDWSTGESGSSKSSIQITEPGNYCVTLTSMDNCNATQCVQVIGVESPKFYVEVTSEEIIIHTTSGNAPFEYSLDGINWQDSNRLGYTSGGLKNVYVREKNGKGCIEVQTVYIPSIPNIVTPNNDWYNDYWDLSGLTYYQKPINVTLYDRWQNLITKLQTNDGKIILNNLKTGTYWYIISIEEIGKFTGWLVVKNR